MKKTLFLLLICSASIATIAQVDLDQIKVKYTFSEPIDNQKGDADNPFKSAYHPVIWNFEIIGNKLAVKKGWDDVYSYRLIDLKNLTATGQRDQDHPADPRYLDNIFFNGAFYEVFRDYSNTTKIENLYLKVINAKGLADGKMNKILTVNEELSTLKSGEASWGDSPFNIYTSTSGKTLAVVYAYKPEDVNNSISKRTLGVSVYNTELNLVWQGNFKLPNTESETSFDYIMVDDEADVYITTLIKAANDKKQHAEVLKLAQNAKEVSVLNINAGENYLQHIKLAKNEELDERYAIQTISGKNDARSGDYIIETDGIGINIIDSKFEVTKSSYYEFPMRIVKQNAYPKDLKAFEKMNDANNTAELNKLGIDSVNFDNDGNVFVYGELFNKPRVKSEDAILMKFDKNGKNLWTDRIPKSQYVNGSAGGTGASFFDMGDLALIAFFDHPKNFDVGEERYPYDYTAGEANLVIYLIDKKTGTKKRVDVFNTVKNNFFELSRFYVSSMRRIDNNSFVFEAQAKKKGAIVYVKVEIER